MKKDYLWTVMGAALLFACSQEDVKEGGAMDTPVPVSMSAKATGLSIQTRGAGTVGGVETESKTWSGNQVIYIDAVDKRDYEPFPGGVLTARKAYVDTEGNVVYSGSYTTPLGGTVDLGSVAYYSLESVDFKHSYDFYAFYVDDAAGSGQPRVQTDSEGEEFVAVTIDGSQDIMAAKAELTESQKRDLAKNERKEEYAFSAYTVRVGVNPILSFDHCLIRFVVSVQAGSESAEKICINDVQIYSCRNGKLYYKKEGEERLVMDENSTDWLSLKELDEDNMTLVDLRENYYFLEQKDGNYNQIGESLICWPARYEGSYTLRITQAQLNEESGEYVPDEPYYLTIPESDENGEPIEFKPGMSYNLKLKLYGKEEVRITTELSKWGNGGNIPIDPDVKK